VDAEERVIGVVTVDDLLEAMVPLEWRHRRGDDRA
jgi:CBS domain containing-hemolysin-like protein